MATAQEILNMIDRLTQETKDLKKQPGAWYEKLSKLAEMVVKDVEFVHDGMEGQNKKDLAEAVILDLYFKHFDSKFIPNFVEKKLITWAVDKCIEAAVAYFNRTKVFKHA